MKRSIVLFLLALAGLLVCSPAAAAQEAELEAAKAARLSLDDILTLLAGGVTPARAATLVKDRGVDFALTPEAENKLRIAGADDALLLAIAKAQPPPPKPEPEPAKPPPPPVDKARAALEKAIESLGGLAALENSRDATITLRSTVATPSGEMTAHVKVYWLRPDKLRNDIRTASGVFTLVWDGAGGWSQWENTVQELAPTQAENGRRFTARLLDVLLLEAHRGERTLRFVGSVALEGHESDVVVVTDARGYAVKLYIEKATGRVLRKESQEFSDTGGLVEAVEMYYDFRPAGDYVVPFREVLWHDGRKVRESVMESWQFNTFLDPSLFARPAGKPARQQPSRRR